MAHSLSTQRLSLVALLTIATLTAAAGLRGSDAAEANTIRVQAGETLEIGTDTASPRSQFSWILTKDRKFQSAQRTRFFQTRIAEPGTYVLDVSVQDPITSENGYRAFTIVVTEPTGGIPAATGDKTKALSAVLQTDPALIGGTAYLDPAGGMIRIDPSGSDGNIATYHIDLDTSVDSDEDGDPTNDVDNLSTLSEKAGTPLYVFMLPKQSARAMKLTVTDLASPEPKIAQAPVQFAAAPTPSASVMPTQNPNSPIIMERDGSSVRFSVKLDETQAAGKDLLFEWDFGDKSKSLLYAPTHTYASAGSYTVSLRIRDIATAEVLYEGIDSVVIEFAPIESSSSSARSDASSSVSSSVATGNTQSKASMKGILQVTFIIVLLLAFAIGLYVLLTWLKRKTATGLQKTLEKMEGTIVSQDTAKDGAAPTPIKIKKEAKQPDAAVVLDREKTKAEFKTQERPNETPVASAGPVPSWLANAGNKTAPFPGTAVSTNTPSPQAKPPAPAVPPVQSDGPAPAWLKPAPAPAVPQSAPKPAPAAAPKISPQPPSAPKPTPAPTEAPKAAPQAQQQQTKPMQAPPAQQQKPAAPAPIQQPKPVVTQKVAPTITMDPKPAPAPAPQKTPDTPKSQPEPVQVKVPTPTPAQQTAPAPMQPSPQKPVVMDIPKATPTPNPSTKNDDDPPIAIIQADSIST